MCNIAHYKVVFVADATIEIVAARANCELQTDPESPHLSPFI